jgi:hypothetical protein
MGTQKTQREPKSDPQRLVVWRSRSGSRKLGVRGKRDFGLNHFRSAPEGQISFAASLLEAGASLNLGSGSLTA